MPDFVYTAADAIPTTPVRRWEANIEAIRTLKQIEAEGRPATPSEQAIFARYSGFGDSAFEQAFVRYPHDRTWKARGEELRDITDQEEYRAIEGSRVNAFYTSREVIDTIWNGLERMGATNLENPRILEPSAGSGRFLGMQPAEMAKRSDRTAVELDSITGRILKHTYPDAKVMVTGFENAPIPDNSIDIAVSNVPFGKVGVFDPAYKGQRFITSRVHNYFFAKTLDKLRPGGVMAFVTSHYTMDAPGARRLREHLAERADLVGAIRLPNDAFPDTQVVTDIIYLRKRMPGEEPGNTDWVDTGTVTLRGRYNDESEHSVNQYYLNNPDAILGVAKATGSQYGSGEYTVESAAGPPLSDRLPQINRRVVGNAPRMQAYTRPAASPSEPAFTPSERPEGKYFVGDGGELKQVSGGREVAPKFPRKNDAARVRAMLAIRDDARLLLDMERDNAADDDLQNLRGTLKGKYEAFVDRYGNLNSAVNGSLMRKDPDASFVRALEVSRDDKWIGADLLDKRVVGGTVAPALQTPEDAFAHTFAQSGTLDFERMGQLLGKDPNAIQVALQNQDLIFENPETGRWESADHYLTGRVRAKLESAQHAADADPKYRKNVAALQEVQPKDIPPGDIAVPLGANWMPAGVLNRWIEERWQPDTWSRNGPKNNFFRYDETLGYWVPEDKIKATEARMRAEWGIKDMAANKILEAALLGKPIIITVPDPEDSKKRVADPVKSLAAQQKVKKMQEDFEEWVWQDPQRGAQLAELYNRTQNDLRPRVFDGNHQTFPGMSADWQNKLRKHQRDAIYRVVQDGTALLAHEVGFGKTAVMVAGGMERKRLGLSRKPVYVVPKATHAQFREQFLELYPQAKVLFPAEKDFTPQNRREFLARVRTGDWDAIILTMDQFSNIPVRPETEAIWQERHVEELRDAFEASEANDDTKSRTHKQIETALKNERKKLAELQYDIANKADQKGEYFEDLGIDQLFVDEADNYKNLRYVTKMGDVKGLPQPKANRSWDMFLKTQYLQGGIEGLKGSGDTDDGRGFARQGVVFATGTPVANTIAEAWTMMRYLQNKELHRRGYQHFDAWVRTYGRIESGLEQTPQGKYKQVTRFANFNNLPELSALLQNVADIRVASEVPQMLEAQPRLVDREGKAKRITEKAPIYPSLKKYMGHLIKRADNMGKVDPSVDNMLKLSSDARKASLDIRMVQWPFEEPPVPNPNGKIPMAAANIAEVYQAEADDKGTQIVFLDLATPKGQSEDKPAKPAKQNEEGEGEGDDAAGNAGQEALTVEEQKIVKDAYNIIRRELLAKGVPADQIAFIHDYDTKKRQMDLFDKVRAGDVRVLLGSTGKLGVGVNVQDRAAAIHHIDVPWRPRDIEQREGRIVRQGNKVYGPVFDEETGDLLNPGKGIKIFNYVQEGSFDEFMWQGVQIKGQAIKSLVKRYVTQRKVEDIDPLVLGAAEAKALASGDPRIMRLEELRQKVQTLRLERAAHDSNARNSAVQAQQLVEQVAAQRRRLPKIETDAQIARKATDAADEFAMTIGAQSHAKRPDADQAIKKSMKALPFKGDWRQVGEYGGLNVMAVNTDTGYRVALLNPATDVLHQSSDITELGGANVVTRIDNVLKGIANSAADLRKKLDQSEESLSFYQGEVGQRFDGSVELKQAEGELQSLRRDIEGVKDDDGPEGEAYEVQADTRVSAIINDSDDDAYDSARAKVMAEVVSTMQTGGRDFVMPTQDDVEERIAQELLKQPRPEPASPPERLEPEPAAEEVPERFVNEITKPEPITEPDATPADPVAEVEPEPIAEPVAQPDLVSAEPVAAAVEPEPAQEPDYVAEPEAVIRWEKRRIVPTRGGIVTEQVAEPDAVPADPVAEVEPEPVAQPVAEPDPVAAEPVATAFEPEPAQEPEYAAVDAMAGPEPDTVSRETPAWEPAGIAAEVSQRVIDDINDADQTGAVVVNERVTDGVADAERPSNIVEQFNDRFDDIPGEDRDQILRAVTEDIPAKVAADEAYRNALAFSDLQNTRIEHDHALQRAVTSLVTTNTALFKEFNDNPAFRAWLTDVNFATTYEPVADRKNQGKDVTSVTNDNPDGMVLEEARDEASTLLPDVLPAKADQLAAPVEQSGRALDLDEAIAIGDVVTEYENLWRRYHAHPDERSSLQEQLNEVRARYWQLIAKYNMNEEWAQRSLDDVESESRYADNPELNEKRESIYRDWAPAIGSERARERADADIAEFVADAYDSPDAPAFELAVPETNTIRPIELPASFADIAPEWSTSDPFSAEAATEPLTVDADHLPTPELDVPAPTVPVPVVIDEPPAFEPMVADEPAPLVESLPAAADPGVAERAAELEQEIALCQTQAEVARQQHPDPTAAVAEVRADIATAEANLEALSDAVGLPDPDTLPDNVLRLELQSDGSVTAVVVESEPERVSDSPTPAPEPEPTPEPTRQRQPVESDQPKEPVEPTRNPDPDHTPGVEAKDAELVDTGRAWQDLTHEEKAKAVAEYNKALSALRTLAEVAREIEETNNVGWAWEAKCSQLQQELTELLRPTPQSPLLAPLIEPMATPAAMPGITVESTGYT